MKRSDFLHAKKMLQSYSVQLIIFFRSLKLYTGTSNIRWKHLWILQLSSLIITDNTNNTNAVDLVQKKVSLLPFQIIVHFLDRQSNKPFFPLWKTWADDSEEEEEELTWLYNVALWLRSISRCCQESQGTISSNSVFSDICLFLLKHFTNTFWNFRKPTTWAKIKF